MGLEVIALAVTAASTVASVVQARKASKARKEGLAVQGAGEAIRDRAAKRRAAREERVRRARLIQSSTTGGTTGSSGESGALSSLGAGFATSRAEQSGQTNVAQGITAASQREASATSRAQTFQAIGNLAVGSVDLWNEWQRQ